MRILLVDDDKEIRFALANVLQTKHNFTVEEASSGAKAIEIGAPILKCFEKSEIFNLIEYVENFFNENGQLRVVSQ